jgi:hypothetical protein
MAKGIKVRLVVMNRPQRQPARLVHIGPAVTVTVAREVPVMVRITEQFPPCLTGFCIASWRPILGSRLITKSSGRSLIPSRLSSNIPKNAVSPRRAGIELVHNVRSAEEVGALLTDAERAGGTIVRPAAHGAWGGTSGRSPT